MKSAFRQLSKLIVALKSLGFDSVNLCAALFRSRPALATENLVLRKQLALFQERKRKAKSTTATDRFVLCRLARLGLGLKAFASKRVLMASSSRPNR